MPVSSSRRARRIGLLLIGNVALAVGLLALIEGLSSLAFGVRDMYRQSGLPSAATPTPTPSSAG